jgi:hypothetical protein
VTTRYQRDAERRQLLAAVAGLARRVEALEARRFAERELLARTDSLSSAVAMLWNRVERLERQGRLAPPAPVQIGTTLSRNEAPTPERIPAAAAARRLGLAPSTVRRLVSAGDLEGLAVKLPDRARRVWVVDVASVERLEREAAALPGALDAANEASAGRGA